MIQAIIFDLDGVLVDAAPWHFKAFRTALSYFGFQISEKQHLQFYNGLPTREKLKLLSTHHCIPASLQTTLCLIKQKLTKEIIEQECHPQTGLREDLIFLKHKGYRLVIASNSVRETLDLVLNRLDIADCFEFTLSSEDVKHPKPNPEIYETVIQQLRLQSDEVLILEDSPMGVQAARNVAKHIAHIQSPTQVNKQNILKWIENAEQTYTNNLDQRLEIVIPMAGEGQRFFEAGYLDPKPMICVFGKPMIAWVIENLKPKSIPHHFTFICHQNHLKHFDLLNLLNSLAPGCSVVSVPSTTQGALCTTLLASQWMTENPLLIANCDQWIENGTEEFIEKCWNEKPDGCILTFDDDHPKWSYAKLGSSGNVVEVQEKNPISRHATVGIYYFNHGIDYQTRATQMLLSNDRVKNEFYVCPVYNYFIQDGKNIQIHEIAKTKMHGLGTPEDLKTFIELKRELYSTNAEVISDIPTTGALHMPRQHL